MYAIGLGDCRQSIAIISKKIRGPRGSRQVAACILMLAGNGVRGLAVNTTGLHIRRRVIIRRLMSFQRYGTRMLHLGGCGATRSRKLFIITLATPLKWGLRMDGAGELGASSENSSSSSELNLRSLMGAEGRGHHRPMTLQFQLHLS